MKKIFFLLVLATGTTGELFAQTSNTEKTFDLPADNIRRKFTVDLGKGNKMQVELSNIDDLDRLANLDSIVQAFIDDIKPLKDSLSGELVSRRIDYIIDSTTFKKIRILKYPPKGSSFVINNGEAASLKLEQDTIVMTGSYYGKTTGILFNKQKSLQYYRVSFFLNDLNDLTGYMDGRLNEKIKILDESWDNNWVASKDGQVHLKKYPEVSASSSHGYLGGSDYLNLKLSVDVQNYKNYFVPSASLGFNITTNNGFVRREFGFSGEFHFLFARNDSGKLQSFRNSFLTLSYDQTAIKTRKGNINLGISPFISLGYLIKRRGDFYDKHTFKLGLGRFSLFGGSTKIEPTFYFNNLFKGVTPSLRIVQNF